MLYQKMGVESDPCLFLAMEVAAKSRHHSTLHLDHQEPATAETTAALESTPQISVEFLIV